MDLGEGIRKAISRLTGATIIDAKVIREFNKELQKALISADVEVALVSTLTKRIEEAALREKLPAGVSPKDYITNMVYEELVKLMGESHEPEIKPKRVLMLGLYGAGKCVHPDTVIPLVNGNVETASNLWNYNGEVEELPGEGSVKKLEAPLEITAFDPVSLKAVKAKATHVWKLKKTDPLIKVSLGNGNAHSVVTTPEHPFFALKNGTLTQVRADELKLGQRIAVPRRALFEDSVDLREDFGTFPTDWVIEDPSIAMQVTEKLHEYGTLIAAYNELKPPMSYCALTAELKRNRVRGWLLNRLHNEGLQVKLPEVIKVKKIASVKWVTLPLELTPQLAEFLGYVFADGNVDQAATHVTNESPEINSRLLEIGQEVFGFKPTFIMEKRSKVGLRRTSFASMALNEYLGKTFGLTTGKKSRTMHLPASLLRAPLETSRSFLQAYFDCDGSIAKNARLIEFCTASKEFASSLRLLLLKHSMHSTFSQKTINGVAYYRIFVKSADTELFATTVSSRVLFKLHRLQNCLSIGTLQSRGWHENIPVGRSLQYLRESKGATIGEIQNYCTSYGIYEKEGVISRGALSSYLSCLPFLQHNNRAMLQMVRDGANSVELRERTAVSRGVANAMAFRLRQTGLITQTDQGVMHLTTTGEEFLDVEENSGLAWLTALAESDVLWIPVERLEKVDGVEYVYDLTVPKYHNFIANGVFVHNTTSTAKLAKFYQDRGLSVGLITCDVTRPAAYEQLETLARQANAAFYGIKGEKDVRKIVREGLRELKGRKVIICDSSGRSAFDKELVDQLKAINDEFKPDEKLLVINADTGQIAGKQAEEFDNAVKITGVIVTKIDGSGRGGGALSAVSAAHVKITFVGTGEKLNAMELYDSKKFVGRLLGIPDIESLIKNVNEAVKEANIKPEELNAEALDFQTFYTQLKTMSKMGPMKNMLGMIGMSDVPKDVAEMGESKLKKYEAIIGSMTLQERKNERLVREHSRIARIAKGSGTSEKDVKALLSDFAKMRKFYEMFKNDRQFNKNLSKFMSKGAG